MLISLDQDVNALHQASAHHLETHQYVLLYAIVHNLDREAEKDSSVKFSPDMLLFCLVVPVYYISLAMLGRMRTDELVTPIIFTE